MTILAIVRTTMRLCIIAVHILHLPFYWPTAILILRRLSRLTKKQTESWLQDVGGRPLYPRGVSVVIPSSDGYDLLEECIPLVLTDLARCEFPYEVLVIDNGTYDHRLAVKADLWSGVSVLRFDSPLGFSEACNEGARRAKYDSLLMLNNDMLIEPKTISNLMDTLWSRQDLFSVTAHIVMNQRGANHRETGNTQFVRYLGMILPTHLKVGIDDGIVAIAYAGGGSSLYKTELFNKAGGFPGVYTPFYFEDAALGLYATRHGMANCLRADTKIVHKHRATIGRMPSRVINRIVERNANLFNWEAVNSLTDIAKYVFLSPLYRVRTDWKRVSLDCLVGYYLALGRWKYLIG